MNCSFRLALHSACASLSQNVIPFLIIGPSLTGLFSVYDLQAKNIKDMNLT